MGKLWVDYSNKRFVYTLHKSKYSDLQEDGVHTLFLKGISEDLLESLNLMEVGDISHKTFAQIDEMCKNYSRSRGKVAKKNWDPFSINVRGNVPISRGVTRVELGNLLENFKTDILGEMGSQLDVLQAKKRQDKEWAAMSILCPRCRTKHTQRECPLNKNILMSHLYKRASSR